MIAGLIVLFVLLIVLSAVLPVLTIVAIGGGIVMVALFAIGLVARLVGGTVRFGFGAAQWAVGLAISLLGLLLLLGAFGALSLALFRFWPVVLIIIGLWWLSRARYR